MNSKLKNILLIVVISFVISVLTVIVTVKYVAKSSDTKKGDVVNIGDTNILYDSSNVSYDNETSGISSSNVQDAIDELYGDAVDYSSINTRLSAVENNLISLDDVYPVGSIYISVNNTNPGTVFGGTWLAFGSGKTLVGVDTNDIDFDTVEESSGAKSVTIETANLPSHTHTVTAAGSVGAHTHTVTAKGTVSSSFTGSSTNTSNHTGHEHTIHNHNIILTSSDTSSTHVGFTATNRSSYASYQASTATGGAHTHTVTAKGTVSSTFTGTSTSTNSVTPTFTGTETNTSAVGSATPTAISTMDPYITVYMWKRTA